MIRDGGRLLHGIVMSSAVAACGLASGTVQGIFNRSSYILPLISMSNLL
jgi:hypothetical protein